MSKKDPAEKAILFIPAQAAFPHSPHDNSITELSGTAPTRDMSCTGFMKPVQLKKKLRS
mgnify:CR=1 FL=1